MVPAPHPGRSAAEVTTRLILPLAGGLILLFAFGRTVVTDYEAANSATKLDLAGVRFGGIFAISVGSLIIGVILMLASEIRSPAFFRGATLNADTPILLADHALPPAVLALPGSEEHPVIPPLTEAELRLAQEDARRTGRSLE